MPSKEQLFLNSVPFTVKGEGDKLFKFYPLTGEMAKNRKAGDSIGLIDTTGFLTADYHARIVVWSAGKAGVKLTTPLLGHHLAFSLPYAKMTFKK